jgi:Na+-translocating ferredoxin:NAD+ oxidoreductase subunit B
MEYGIFLLLFAMLLCALAWATMYCGFFDKPGLRTAHLQEKINALLPQTQCGKCHYEACRPYAAAIATGEADINHCPPGGDETIKRIAMLLGRDIKKLDSDYPAQLQGSVALIDEQICIGCVKCIQACPVDAIIGAAKQMHTVINKACTGCELCIAPCPVDCISMVPVNVNIKRWIWTKPQTGFEARR